MFGQKTDVFVSEVLIEYKNKDPNHGEWAKALKELYLPGLRDYVKSYYPLGPVWGTSGNATLSAAPKAAGSAAPPPPPASLFTAKSTTVPKTGPPKLELQMGREIVEVLTESLTLKETSIPTKVARLMLVSDILHNSSVPVKNASAYRTKFEATLPTIMESFNDLYRSISGRKNAEALKEKVLKVLQVWSDWFLFSDAYVNGLRATFLRPSSSGVVPFHSISGDAPELEQKIGSAENVSDGIKANQDVALAMGEGAAMKELLSLPLPELERRCRHNGLSLVGGREMMVARLLYLGEAEKQRGSELEEDLKFAQTHLSTSRYANVQKDTNAEMESRKSSAWNYYGDDDMISETREPNTLPESLSIPQPELKAFKKEKAENLLPASKWAREDDDGEPGSENAADDLGNAEDDELAAQTSTATQPEITINEEQRQKMRLLEVALIEYRESLEEGGVKSSEDIERKVAVYRKRLESEYGLSDSGKDPSRSKRTSKRNHRESSRKRQRIRSRSGSLPRRGSNREKEDVDRDYRAKDRAKSHDSDSDRNRSRSRDRERSGGLERDDSQRDKDRRRRIR
ncbi:unnamed protein product [Amaranthus hypochondriacus]